MKILASFARTGYGNCYVLGPDAGGAGMLIDPPFFDEAMLTLIETSGLYPSAVLLTHGHEAHAGGVKTLVKIYDCEVFYHGDSVFGIPTTTVGDNTVISRSGIDVSVIQAPGHSDDSVLYRMGDYVFTGDTIAAGLLGTVSGPTARRVLIDTIRTRLLPLGDHVIILPGHGPPTRIGIERRLNAAMRDDTEQSS